MEHWKPIPSHLGYEASDLGRIRSVDHEVANRYVSRVVEGKILKPYQARNGYLVIALGRDAKHCSVHRLVAETFLGPPPEGKKEVNHRNLIKTDNRVSNLEWVTPVENMAHARANGALENARLKTSKPTLCKETGQVFSSSYAAAEWVNSVSKGYSGLVKNMSTNIRMAVKSGKMRYGYHWTHV